jgi:hypothetical protein
MVQRVAQGHIDDLVVKVAVIIQDQLFDKFYQRPVGIDLPAESAEYGKIVDGFFKIVRIVPNVKGAELLQERGDRNRNGATLFFDSIIQKSSLYRRRFVFFCKHAIF